MPQITLVWAALGLLIGLFARLTGARPYYPREAGALLPAGRWPPPPPHSTPQR